MGVHTVLARGPTYERPPAAADIQQPFAGPQAQLAANVLKLVALRRVQRIGGLLEVGAGVHPLLVQPQPIELVGHVIVERDRGAIAVARMPVREAPGDPGCEARIRFDLTQVRSGQH